jgi:16S rRNA (adenine1518-N6/adenine1519-N6)-dimethyltransferase
MFQREVADRIEADAGSRTYGSLSVQVQVRARAERLVTLPPEAFHPAPKVYSAVVGFVPHPNIASGGVSLERFDRTVRLGFSARRKTLTNAFGAQVGREEAAAWCHRAGISPGSRAEQVDVEGWRRLAAHHP